MEFNCSETFISEDMKKEIRQNAIDWGLELDEKTWTVNLEKKRSEISNSEIKKELLKRDEIISENNLKIKENEQKISLLLEKIYKMSEKLDQLTNLIPKDK